MAEVRYVDYYERARLLADSSEKNKTACVRINVTLRRVRVTIVAVEKQKVLHILSVCL
jgi:hypothetical protein